VKTTHIMIEPDGVAAARAQLSIAPRASAAHPSLIGEFATTCCERSIAMPCSAIAILGQCQ